jgi:UDP-glucose 4-epimerase
LNAPAPSTRPGHVLVTGGAGFIGSHLVERLLAEGRTAVVIDDLSTGKMENLQTVAGDPRLRVIVSRLSACTELPALVAGACCIYHLAAAVGVELVLNSPIHTLETNLHETEVLLQLAARHGTPFLLTSSSEVYGKSEKASFSEEDDLLIGPPSHIRWSYACSKLMDEFLALAYGRERALPVIVARLFNTVGPRQTGNYGMVLPRFIASARRGEPLRVFGDGRQTRCFCYVSDAIEALVGLMHCANAQGQVFNVGNTEETSILNLARTVIELVGSTSRIELVPYDHAYVPGFEDMRQRKPDISRLKATIGFHPATSLRDIITRTASVQ